eukprot:scaffold11429_cov88-Skeletonema_dohrnii-CCMP3373.AAC.1
MLYWSIVAASFSTLDGSIGASFGSTSRNQSIYLELTEAMVGETALSRGSDCDAVWFCPRRMMKTPIVG